MRNSREIPGVAADIVVVGGGAAGCVVARRLADTGVASVLLVEAGPDLRLRTPPELRDGWQLASPPDWGFSYEPTAAGNTGKLRRGRLLGGTGWLTRFAVRGARVDFDAWAARGNPGWAFEDVLPAFRRLETDEEYGDRPWHGDRGPVPISRYPELSPSPAHEATLEAFDAMGFPAVDDHNEPGAVGYGRMPMSSRRGVRVTSVDAYLPPDATPRNLAVRADTTVARVLIDSGRAVGVRLAAGADIRADRVVLAAGTYGSPTILLRSGIGPAGDLGELGIDVRIDLPGVGANLADHPRVDLDSGWRGEATTGPILHSIATFRSSLAEPGGAPDLMFWVADPEGDEPRLEFDPILLKPDARGTVRLRSADPGDPPRITLPDIREGRDVERLAEAIVSAWSWPVGRSCGGCRAAIRRRIRGRPPVCADWSSRTPTPSRTSSAPAGWGPTRRGATSWMRSAASTVSRVSAWSTPRSSRKPRRASRTSSRSCSRSISSRNGAARSRQPPEHAQRQEGELVEGFLVGLIIATRGHRSRPRAASLSRTHRKPGVSSMSRTP